MSAFNFCVNEPGHETTDLCVFSVRGSCNAHPFCILPVSVQKKKKKKKMPKKCSLREQHLVRELRIDFHRNRSKCDKSVKLAQNFNVPYLLRKELDTCESSTFVAAILDFKMAAINF